MVTNQEYNLIKPLRKPKIRLKKLINGL